MTEITARSMAGMVALAAVLGAAGTADAQDKVRFGTNWLAQAEHGGYYQAVADGTYEACGLDVEIVPGGPQVNHRAQLVAGKLEFYMGGNMLQPFQAQKEGIPIKVVAAHFQKEPQVILTHPGQGLDTWEDVKKAETLFIADEGFLSYYQWMMDEFGFKEEQRKPYTFNAAPFIADPKSGQQGYVTSEPYAVEKEGGFKPNVFLIADYGFNTYATTVETMESTIADHPDWVRCFVDGSSIGWYNYLYGDPSAANELIKAANPEMTDGQIAFSIEQLKSYGIVDSGDAETLGIGAMTAERHQSFYDKMVAAGVVDAGIDVTKTYTLDFVNKGVGLDVKRSLMGQ